MVTAGRSRPDAAPSGATAGFPYKPIKLRGWVDDLNRTTVWARVFVGGETWPEYEVVIDRSQFGPDADRLARGTYVSLPARRDRRWMVTPIPPLTDVEYRRALAKGRIRAGQIRRLLDCQEAA